LNNVFSFFRRWWDWWAIGVVGWLAPSSHLVLDADSAAAELKQASSFFAYLQYQDYSRAKNLLQSILEVV
jgi:hypothetical protein